MYADDSDPMLGFGVPFHLYPGYSQRLICLRGRRRIDTLEGGVRIRDTVAV